MNVLIISLLSQQGRRAFQLAQMARLGLSYEFVDATSATDVSPALCAQLRDTWERPLRPAEVSCFLSHLRAWQMVVKQGSPALILEDDALLASTVPSLLAALSLPPQPMDLLTLEVRARKKIVGTRRHHIAQDTTLIELFQDRTGAAGYVLWPTGAQLLLDKASTGVAALADAFISSHYALRAFQAEPALIVQLDLCKHYGIEQPLQTTSSISSTARPPKARSLNLFTYRRVMSQLRMGWRALSVLHRARRRYIKLDASLFHRP